ncbi:hypothetical protein [Longimicrobium sp.]|jgi:hypothetical protein
MPTVLLAISFLILMGIFARRPQSSHQAFYLGLCTAGLIFTVAAGIS